MSREQDVYELIRQLKIAATPANFVRLEERIDEMTGEIETLKLAIAPPHCIDHWSGLKLQPMEHRIVVALERAGKMGLTKAGLMQAIYFDKDEWPDIKCLDVFVFHIRAKLARTRFRVRNVFGVGFILEEKAA